MTEPVSPSTINGPILDDSNASHRLSTLVLSSPTPSSSSNATSPSDALTGFPDQDPNFDQLPPSRVTQFRSILQRFLPRIIKAVSTSKKYKTLRDASRLVLATLDEHPKAIARAVAQTFRALQITCESAKSSAVEVALECIHSLFEHGFIGGKLKVTRNIDTNTKTNELDMDFISLDPTDQKLELIITFICSSLETKDDSVYLRCVQCLLTAVKCTTKGLHHTTLLAAVRTIYNINLNAHTAPVRTSSRAALTQIINVVFGNLEQEAQLLMTEAMQNNQQGPRQEQDEKAQREHTKKRDHAHQKEQQSHSSASQSKTHSQSPNRSLTESRPSQTKTQALTREALTRDPSFACISHSNLTLSSSSLYLNDQEQNFSKQSTQPQDDDTASSDFSSVTQKDAYLLFRALCKLSSKDVPASLADTPDSIAQRSKLLSLELLKYIAYNANYGFRNEPKFVYALRHYLAASIIANCMSSNMQVVNISLEIFRILLMKKILRPVLKDEIDAVFQAVIFRFIESSSSGLARKKAAIQVLQSLSNDPQALADIFVNYDCDIEQINIFEKSISCLSSAAIANTRQLASKDSSSSSSSSSPPSSTYLYSSSSPSSSKSQVASLETDIKKSATLGIIGCVHSIREWGKPMEQNLVTQLQDVQDDYIVATTTQVNSQDDSQQLSDQPLQSERLTIPQDVSDESDTIRVQQMLRKKKILEEGVKLFNKKPKKGLELIFQHQIIENDPAAVAKFLSKTSGLDATMIGEYLGEAAEFNVAVMHCYTDMQDFVNLSFDQAIRQFLSGFRLPGEAQKIDRIMEKFASRYCACNPKAFANADAAYVLAYSVIMLNTDAHNAQVKTKMSKEDFLRNNRGINDGADLDKEFLGSIYDRIVKNQIRLKDTITDSKLEGVGGIIDASVDSAKRAELFREESERLLTQTRVTFAKRRRLPGRDEYVYYTASNIHHAILMFEVTWKLILSALSTVLDTAEENESVMICLKGFQDFLSVSSTFRLETPRSEVLAALSKQTSITNPKHIKPKHIECMKMLLIMASTDGNNFGQNWLEVARTLSTVAYLRAIAEKNPEKHVLSNKNTPMLPLDFLDEFSDIAMIQPLDSSSLKSSDLRSSYKSQAAKAAAIATVDPSTTSAISLISEEDINALYKESYKLETQAVLEFIIGMCKVCIEELKEAKPKVYCLQSVVQLAYYNMSPRTRIEWSRIWEVLVIFFNRVLCWDRRSIVRYSIMSLKQLALKYFEKEELANYSFQRSILKPFEVCCSRIKTLDIREDILKAILEITEARADHIKSGWKVVFGILALCAEDNTDTITTKGFELMDIFVRKYFGSIDEAFIDGISGLAAYSKCQASTTISLMALDHLIIRCPDLILQGKAVRSIKPFSEDIIQDSSDSEGIPVKKKDEIFSEEDDGHISVWFPTLMAIANAIQDTRTVVKTHATEGLFEVLEKFGSKFTSGLWSLIFRGVLQPIFDDIKYLPKQTPDGVQQSDEGSEEWATTTGSGALRLMIDTIVKHIDHTRHLLNNVLELLRKWIIQEHESIAKDGIGALRKIIDSAGPYLDENEWKLLVNFITDIFTATCPRELLGSPTDEITNNNLFAESNVSTPERGENVEKMENRGDEEEDDGGKPEEYDKPGHYVEFGNHEKEATAVEHEESSKASPTKREILSREEMSGENSSLSEDEKDQKRETTTSQDSFIDFKVVRCKCVVQILLIETVQNMVETKYIKLSTPMIISLTDSLRDSYRFARKFNENLDLRFALWRAGFMSQVPNLIKQETTGIIAYMQILFWLYLDRSKDSKTESMVEEKLIVLMKEVLETFIDASREARKRPEDSRELLAYAPVVTCTLIDCMHIHEDQFKKLLPMFYELFLGLIEVESREIRLLVSELLKVRVGSVLGYCDGYLPNPKLPEGLVSLKLRIQGTLSEEFMKELKASLTKKNFNITAMKMMEKTSADLVIVISGGVEQVVTELGNYLEITTINVIDSK